MRLWPLALSVAYFFVRAAVEGSGAPPAAVSLVDVAFYVALLYSLVQAVEEEIARYGNTRLFNVLVVSWAAAIPQTVVAIALAQGGRYEAAFYDSMVSTLIDAFIVTALVRLAYLDRLRAEWWLAAAWSASALAYGATLKAFYGTEWDFFYHAAWFAAGAIGLPLLLAGQVAIPRARPDVVSALNAAMSTVALMYVAWQLGQALAAWHETSEAALGALAAAISTAPDLIVAFIIRITVARYLGDISAEDAVRTMLAAAVHDQISIPALVVLLFPDAVWAFPHWLNAYVAVLVLTLLDRRLFLAAGLPAAVATVAAMLAGLI